MGGFGWLWYASEALEGMARFWKALGSFWYALRGFGSLWEPLRLCKGLDALEGFGGFISLWQVWKALGSFDVNMVCPLPGSWINHVCMYF